MLQNMSLQPTLIIARRGSQHAPRQNAGACKVKLQIVECRYRLPFCQNSWLVYMIITVASVDMCVLSALDGFEVVVGHQLRLRHNVVAPVDALQQAAYELSDSWSSAAVLLVISTC